jgi:hypothetical protein
MEKGAESRTLFYLSSKSILPFWLGQPDIRGDLYSLCFV